MTESASFPNAVDLGSYFSINCNYINDKVSYLMLEQEMKLMKAQELYYLLKILFTKLFWILMKPLTSN